MANLLHEELKRNKLRSIIYEYIERVAPNPDYTIEAEDYVEDFISIIQLDWERIKEVMECK